MHQHVLVGYLASQFLGAGLVVLIWRERAASVHNGVTAPGVGYPIWSVFLIEMGLTCLLVLAIFLFVSSHRLMRWAPLMTWLLVAFMYWQASPISGSSLKPLVALALHWSPGSGATRACIILLLPSGRCLPSSSFDR